VIFKILIFVLLGLILISLGAGMFFLGKDDKESNRLVTSLTVRIVLSFLLLVVLVVGYLTGQIVPHSL